MSKRNELGTGWEITGHVATRGSVQVLHMANPSRYHAKALGHNRMDYDCPVAALAKLRETLANDLARHESALDDIAETMADIDAPEPPKMEV